MPSRSFAPAGQLSRRLPVRSRASAPSRAATSFRYLSKVNRLFGSATRSGCLLLLESQAGELQGPAVLGDGAHDVVRRARRYLRFDLEGDLDGCSDQTGQVGNNLIGNAARIPANAG